MTTAGSSSADSMAPSGSRFRWTCRRAGQDEVTFLRASPADRPAGSGVINVGVYGVDASWFGNQVVPVTGGPGEWHSYVTWEAPSTDYLPAGPQTLTMWAAAAGRTCDT